MINLTWIYFKNVNTIPWKSQLTIILYAVKSNRVSIHRASTKTISNHDDNPRSWIKFKVDILIAVAETSLQTVSTKLIERAWKESAIDNHNIKVFLLFRFHLHNITIIESLVITLIHFGSHVKDFFWTKLISITLEGF